MRLSRPVALGLLVLCALVVLWLVVQNLPPGDSPGAGSSEGSQPPGTAYAQDGEAGPTGTDTRDWDDIDGCRDDVLPTELGDVTEDVEAGGPFAYDGKDGSTFGNHEGYLPDESRGYYREYTVETPGLDHRGARRIVTGGGATDPEVWYYTADHYESFCEFAP
jgi:guanyl-specific ribonuclease Sa